MSVYFSHVSIGERVKLTRHDGHEAVLIVRNNTGTQISSGFNVFDATDWDTVETLPPPLPSKHLAFIGHPSDKLCGYFIHSSGVWLDGNGDVVPTDWVQWYVDDQGFEVLFPGVDNA